MKKMMRKIPFLAVLLFGLSLAQCSELSSSDVFSEQVTAEQFVSELNGFTTQTVTINHQENSEIAWAKLMEDKDFKYFQIEKVTANGSVIVQDGTDDFVANSRAEVPSFSVSSTTGASNEFVNGSLNLTASDGVQFRIRFAPQEAPDNSDKPFEATLAIYYTEPQEGLYLVDLEGYVQGVKADKCTQNISTFDIHEYQFVDGEFGFYMCSPEVAATGNENAPDHGASTNYSKMPIDGNFYFYQPDDETVCLMHGGNLAGPENPSLPDFDFLIPEGLAEVDSLPISLFSTASCDLSAEGAISCPENVYLDTLISIAPLTGTTGEVAAEDLVTTQCPDFGSISGSGNLGDDNVTMVFHGTVLEDSITASYNIADALIVAFIELTK